MLEYGAGFMTIGIEYLYISYPKGIPGRFLSIFSQIWCVIHIVGAIGAIIWAWC